MTVTKTPILSALTAALFFVCLFTPMASTAMAVSPLVLNLEATGRRTSTVVRVENILDRPLTVELSSTRARIDESGLNDTFVVSEDILIFPAQALIEPGKTQSFRVQYVGDPELKQSEHFLVSVAQLPVQLPEGQNAVQVLYNFMVVASVGITGASPNIEVTESTIKVGEDQKPRVNIKVRNDSNNYGYLADGRMRIIQKDNNGKEVFNRLYDQRALQESVGFGLVPAKGVRELLMSEELPTAEGTVTAEFLPPRRRR